MPTVAAAWLANGDLALIVYGSSSCPSIVSSIRVISAVHLSVRLGTAGGDVCTTDLAPTTTIIPRPAGIDRTRDVQIDIPQRGSIIHLPHQ